MDVLGVNVGQQSIATSIPPLSPPSSPHVHSAAVVHVQRIQPPQDSPTLAIALAAIAADGLRTGSARDNEKDIESMSPRALDIDDEPGSGSDEDIDPDEDPAQRKELEDDRKYEEERLEEEQGYDVVLEVPVLPNMALRQQPPLVMRDDTSLSLSLSLSL
jgi:hypothetical protein